MDKHWTHPDPEIRRLIAEAYARGKADGIKEAQARRSRKW